MRFALLIALSHLRSRKQEMGVSAITLISTGGVTIGVSALIIVLSVMAGFEIDLRDKILGSNAHIVVLKYGAAVDDYNEATDVISEIDEVVGAAPFIYTEMMVKSENSSGEGVILKGVDPARVGDVVDISKNLVMGPNGAPTSDAERQAILDNLGNPERSFLQDEDDGSEFPGILLGEELAHSLKVFVGDKVHIINPVGRGVGPFGTPIPDVKAFRVAGIYYSGMYEYDTKWTYVTIEDAQEFLKMGDAVTGIEVTVEDIYGVDPVALDIEAALQYPYYTRHWKNLNRHLFDALRLEKQVMGLILSLIVSVASLNIVGTMILVVLTKGREIAIMKAMGATSNQIRAIFMSEGVIIGVVGAVLGTGLGLFGCWFLEVYGYPLNTDVYYLDTLPVQVEPAMVALVAVSAVVICFLATLYPASRAAALHPVEGLRNE
ncbi:MAG: ABC transporter permease [Proteobacteria bacterium]|nr:ABC transporter permease [Pseudomonadota bacterium]MCP4920681.1 ABC transporter permease [Pseudomonadota bacterium]